MIILELPTGERNIIMGDLDFDGRLFTIQINYLERAGSWYLSMDDANDERLISGQRLVTNLDYLRHHRARDSRVPPGNLIVMSRSRALTDPTLESLGDDHFLIYELKEEADAVEAAYASADKEFTVVVL